VVRPWIGGKPRERRGSRLRERLRDRTAPVRGGEQGPILLTRLEKSVHLVSVVEKGKPSRVIREVFSKKLYRKSRRRK